MKILLIISVLSMFIALSSCQKVDISNVAPSSETYDYEVIESDNTMTYINEIISQQQGYVDIPDSIFLEKAEEVEYNMFAEDLDEIYGVEGYNDPYLSGLDVFYCFNDNYLLRVVRGGSVIVYNIQTKESEIIKQSGDGSVSRTRKF